MAFGLGVAKGMLTTISHLVRPPLTVQYPEQRLDVPIWTRGRPRLLFEVDTGELRCTACGACALACPVDVIKIEQHPSPVKGKILDRFDIDMAGCIECALCVEACPFRAITMAPDFEMASTYDRTTDLVFDMYELRLAGTPEVDAGMEHIQGVKRGLRGQAAPAAPARPAPAMAGARGPVAGQATGATAAATSSDATGNQVASAAAVPAAAVASGQGEDARAAAAAASAAAPVAATAPTDYDPLTISDDDLKKLPPADRAKVYRARLKASGWQPPTPAS